MDSPWQSSRRRRALVRLSPGPDDDPKRVRRLMLAGAAAIAFAAEAVEGASSFDVQRDAAERYGQAWERQDYAAMHGLLDDAARRRTPLPEFAALHRDAAQTATLAALRAGRVRDGEGDELELPIIVDTRVFGTLRTAVRTTVREEDGRGVIAWEPHMVFGGLRPGEILHRETTMPPRAAILARDGTPLAAGEPRLTDLGSSAAQVLGHLGPPAGDREASASARGLPPGTPVGQSGLEQALEGRLAGRPGGRLLAGSRVVARAQPRRGADVRTMIDPALQASAVQALAGRYGAAVALDPADGEVLAIAGAAALAPQPPGSVFKIITLAAALEHGVVEPGDSFPVENAAVLEGVRLENADGEACGGTLRNAFAHSCNSVFAPLGVSVGAARLVEMAERFGFNGSSRLPGEPPSSMPAPEEIGDSLALGSTAIGQGRLLATTTEMASVAATIAAGGRRAAPTLLPAPGASPRRVIEPAVARVVAGYMAEVVRSGTGTAAALPDVQVAGKTGTAELRRTVEEVPVGEEAIDDPTDTDAWFAAFAPRRKPRVAVAVLLVGGGTGGTTAAPAARVMLQAALQREAR